ncbi:MAG TPA: hypothetical protein VM347_39440 [Nonomuraea sp.]|nr:hypothetical protein [Nonomuraea sp.]
MNEIELDCRRSPTNGRGQPMDEVEFDRRPKPPTSGRGQPMDEVEFDRRPNTPKTKLTGGPVAHAPVGKVDFDPWASTATGDECLRGQPMDEVEFD